MAAAGYLISNVHFEEGEVWLEGDDRQVNLVLLTSHGTPFDLSWVRVEQDILIGDCLL